MARRIIRLRPPCPSCGRKFRVIVAMNVAVSEHVRTCQNPECRERWRMLVKPLLRGKISADEVTYTAYLGHAPGRSTVYVDED